METRALGTSGIQASKVILGTWAIGGWMWGGADDAASIDAIKATLDAGINCIDTAPVYGFGHSETIVGKAIAGRDDVVIATKCGLVWDNPGGEPFFESEGKSIHKYLSADAIRTDVEASLKRLNVDSIDLMQTHWQDTTTPIEETMTALMALKDEGKIKAIGVSNATLEQIREYQKFGVLDSDQEKYSMLDRGIEDTALPHCLENNIAVLAYSPMALGILTGKIGPERTFGEGDLRKNNPRFSVENRKAVIAFLEELRPIADAHQATFAQLVIAWTVAQPGLTHALVGARTPEQAIENAKAGEISLSSDELQTIESTLNKHRSQLPAEIKAGTRSAE